MPRLISHPTVVPAGGNKSNQTEEFAGRVASGQTSVSVARMATPAGWREPGQRAEFEEVTVVLKGMLRIEHQGGVLNVHAGQAVVTAPGEWVCFSAPEPGGAEYIAVCSPAYSPTLVTRDQAK